MQPFALRVQAVLAVVALFAAVAFALALALRGWRRERAERAVGERAERLEEPPRAG